MNTYKVNEETKFWNTKASASRVANKLNDESDEICWVLAWEYEKGWFLEDLMS